MPVGFASLFLDRDCYIGSGDTNNAAWLAVACFCWNCSLVPDDANYILQCVHVAAVADTVAEVRLYDLSADAEISGSKISGMQGTTPTVYETSLFVMPTEKVIVEFQMRLTSTQGEEKAFVHCARLIY